MRESPYGNRIVARQMFLDANKPFIVDLYKIPIGPLEYDSDVTEIVHNNIPVGISISDSLHYNRRVNQVLEVATKFRTRLIRNLESPTSSFLKNWDIHMDYEALILDKMINLDLLPAKALLQPSGRSFYMQQRIFCLMHQVNQLIPYEKYHERAAWYANCDDNWHFRMCATKFRLIDILQNYTEEWEAEFNRANVVECNSIDETVEAIKNIHREIIISGSTAKVTLKQFINDHPEEEEYMRFVTAAIEYNEELRLLRSQSVVPFIKCARRAGIEPYQAFLDALECRKRKISSIYGGKI